MKILCVIGARGNSKRLKRKNLQKYNNTTLLEWAIQNALKSKFIDKIVVDSEDNEILKIAMTYPIKAHQREPSLSEDDVSLYTPIKKVLEKYDKYDLIVILQVDNPVAGFEQIDYCIDWFLNNDDAEDISTFFNDRRTGTVRVIHRKFFFSGFPTANIYAIEDRPDYIDIHTRDDLIKANEYLKNIAHDTLEIKEKFNTPIEYNTRVIYYHMYRYFKANELLNIQKTDMVLDCSCGQGYGTFILSQNAGHVFGLDVNENYLALAKKEYKKTNIAFHTYKKWETNKNIKINKIVCIETIEHLPKKDIYKFANKLMKYLEENGDLCVICPIGEDKPSEYNKFHLNEPSIDTLYNLFTPHFKHSCFYIDNFVNSFDKKQEYCILILKGKYHVF